MPRLDSHLKKSLFVILKLTQVFVLLVCLSGRVLLQNANATVYSPGQTLEPDCAPGSLNCGVATLVGATYGGTGLAVLPSYGNLLVGNSSGGYTLTATSSLGLGGGSGTVTSVALTAPTGLTVVGSPITASGTLALSFSPGYALSLTASSTEYDTAYANRITSASSPLSITNHALSLSTAGDWTGTFDGQEGLYYLDARNLSNFGAPFYTFFSATTTDALTQGSLNKYYSDTLVNSFTHSSSTIPKTYTANMFTGSNTFIGEMTVNSITATSTTATSTFANGINITAGCFAKNGTCIGGGSDLQTATSFLDTNVALGTGATSTLTTVNITPSTDTGDVFVQAEVSIRSASNTDGTAVVAIRKTNCTGTVLSQMSEVITEGNAVGASSLFLTAVDVDAGASSQAYVLCGSAVTQGHTATTYSLSATVIDTGADVAEVYTTNDANLSAGDVVSLDSELVTGVKKSVGAFDKNVIGIVSTKPGNIIGGVGVEGVKAVPVALSGRVPVKVNTENGTIIPGDYLAPSSVPGVAMRANDTGSVLGQAMSAYSGEGVGTVLAFVKNFYRNEEGSFSGEMDGLSTLVETVFSEPVQKPADVMSKKIAEGKKFAVDFVAARVTALRGYFDELFADKVHTKQICLEKSGGSEICFNGDDAATFFENKNRNAPEVSEPSIISEPVEVPVVEDEATSTAETVADENKEVIQ